MTHRVPALRFAFVLCALLVASFATASDWKQQPGSAKRIAAGPDGSVWALGTNPAPGGFGVWRWNGTAWLPVEGGGVEIAVDPKGHPWVVSDNGTVWKWNGSGWTQQPGSGKDIAVGANGAVWALGTNPALGGWGVWRWKDGGWVAVDGGGVSIAVAADGTPWVVSENGSVWKGKP